MAYPCAGRLVECAGQGTQRGQRQVGREQIRVGERELNGGRALVVVKLVVGQERVDGRRSFNGRLLITEGV
jgi:hypothetical protein